MTAHTLGGVEAAVWRLCDGTLTTSEIAQRLDRSDDDVNAVIDRLSRANLLKGTRATGRLMSRRFAMQLLAGGAAAAAFFGRGGGRPARAGGSGA